MSLEIRRYARLSLCFHGPNRNDIQLTSEQHRYGDVWVHLSINLIASHSKYYSATLPMAVEELYIWRTDY